MAFTIIPVGDVSLSTVEGVSDYHVRLPLGSQPIASMFTGSAPAIADGKGVYLQSTKRLSSAVIDDCEDDWNELDAVANVTNAQDAVDYKVGTQCLQLTVAAAVAAGTLLASEVTAVGDLDIYTHVEFWIKCSVAAAAGDLAILLDEHAKCVSPLETLNVPALTAGVWRHCRVALANPQLDLAIISVGLSYVVDIGACVIHIDDVRAVTLDRVVEGLVVDSFNEEYFVLSEGLENDDCRSNRLLFVYYYGPDENPECSN